MFKLYLKFRYNLHRVKYKYLRVWWVLTTPRSSYRLEYFHHPRKFSPTPFHSSDFSHHWLILSLSTECTLFCLAFFFQRDVFVSSCFWEAQFWGVGDLFSPFSLQPLVCFAIPILCFCIKIAKRAWVLEPRSNTCPSPYCPCCLEQVTWHFQTFFSHLYLDLLWGLNKITLLEWLCMVFKQNERQLFSVSEWGDEGNRCAAP